MKIDIAHSKNPLMGWDLTIKVTAEAAEKIATFEVLVNMSPAEPQENFDPPISVFTKRLERKGNYPGENTVQVIVHDQNNNETSAEDSWE